MLAIAKASAARYSSAMRWRGTIPWRTNRPSTSLREALEHLRAIGGIDVLVTGEVQCHGVTGQPGDGIEQRDDALAGQPVGHAEHRQSPPGPQVTARQSSLGRRQLVTRRDDSHRGMPDAAGAQVGSQSLAGHDEDLAGPPRCAIGQGCRPATNGSGVAASQHLVHAPTSGGERRCHTASHGPSVFDARLSTTTTSASLASRQHGRPVDDGERVSASRDRHEPHRGVLVGGQFEEAAVVQRATRHPVRIALGDERDAQHLPHPKTGPRSELSVARPRGVEGLAPYQASCSGATRRSTARSISTTTP